MGPGAIVPLRGAVAAQDVCVLLFESIEGGAAVLDAEIVKIEKPTDLDKSTES
jgi:hypothetical protein